MVFGEIKPSVILNNYLKDCINEAIKKTQKLMAQKMQEMGGLPSLM